jgi:hypothetical protein
MKTSTFKKNIKKKTLPKGTKPSVFSSQLLISSGLNDFDGKNQK